MTGGRQSDYSLFVSGPGILNLTDGKYRFSGGTEIAGGTLVVWDTLVSDVTVAKDYTGLGFEGQSELWLTGTLRGNLINQESVTLRHKCGTGLNVCLEDGHPRIEGNYLQAPSATLTAVLGWDLQITGQASLDGLLTLIKGTSASYVLPSSPSSVLVLHADDGVSGQFVGWNTQSLFLQGTLRYTAHDVYLDLTRLSVQAAMAAAAVGDTLTQGTAETVDHAFLAADSYASLPDTALSPTQRQFLTSAATIQHMGNYAQAITTLDTVSGHGHAATVDALLRQATTSGSRSSARIGSLRPGAASGFWSGKPALVATDAGTFTSSQTAGFDQWLDDRMVLGSSFAWRQGNVQFDRAGGSMRSQSPQWNVYLRRNGSKGAYAMGEVGHARHQVDLDRPIALGNALHAAKSQRHLEVTHAYAETGRDFGLGNGRLTPFAAVSHAVLHGGHFVEQGNTGLELMVQPSLHQRTDAAVGLRYARYWRWADDRWMRLNLGAGYQHILATDDGMRAAFTGTPAFEFDLGGLSHRRGNGWLEMQVVGGGTGRWTWLFSYQNQASEQVLSLGFERAL